MNQKDLIKQISTTQTDIFPLDKMLPLVSVYKIFRDIYEKEPQKATFLDNSKYKRLREGYFGLFVAVALNHWEEKEHFMNFPSQPQNDINILSIKDATRATPLFNKMVCDVKEFTHHEKSFIDFIKKNTGPKLKIYSIIIGSHRDIANFKPLYDMVVAKKALTTYIVTAADKIDSDFNMGLVTMLSPAAAPIQLKVYLKEMLPIDSSPPLVYHDKLRDKLA